MARESFARLFIVFLAVSWCWGCAAKSDSSSVPAPSADPKATMAAAPLPDNHEVLDAIVNDDIDFIAAHPELTNLPIRMMDGSSTPLVQAIAKGKIDIAEQLLKQKADPNKLDDDWVSPLKLAIRSADVDLVKQLLDAGANVDSDVHPESPDPVLGKKSPAEVAARVQDPEKQKQILDLLNAAAKN